jgi:hypothetical protein
MRIKLLAGVAVIATGVGLSPVTSGTALVQAAPGPPSPCLLNCPGPSGAPRQGAPLQSPNNSQPFQGEFGGGPKSGGRLVG